MREKFGKGETGGRPGTDGTFPNVSTSGNWRVGQFYIRDARSGLINVLTA